jgi:hypothetical protein
MTGVVAGVEGDGADVAGDDVEPFCCDDTARGPGAAQLAVAPQINKPMSARRNAEIRTLWYRLFQPTA